MPNINQDDRNIHDRFFVELRVLFEKYNAQLWHCWDWEDDTTGLTLPIEDGTSLGLSIEYVIQQLEAKE